MLVLTVGKTDKYMYTFVLDGDLKILNLMCNII